MMKFDAVDQKCVNAIRMLSCDCIEEAGSGHPGLPLGSAPMAYVLWRNYLHVNPSKPNWINRDRFILSAGHGSAMLYSLLHLSGFQLTVDDLKHFRQLDSKTPGHPEYAVTCGVDATTGPLGQGFAMAVGMAMAEVHLAKLCNHESIHAVDHHTFVLCSDGNLMEGVSHEAASLAGHLKLKKLVVLYDSNSVSLDGDLRRTCSDDTRKRFESYGWDYCCVSDGNQLEAIDQAIYQATHQNERPTLIEVKTTIGYGAPGEGTHKIHGTPLGSSGLAHLRRSLHWAYDPFTVPEEVNERFKETLLRRGIHAESQWRQLLAQLGEQCPQKADLLALAIDERLPDNWADNLPRFEPGNMESGRETSRTVIQQLAANIPLLWGGSADLGSSNKTDIQASGLFSAIDRSARNIAFGVREFAEGAILNGIMLHKGNRVFGATFLTFSDYMRAAIRMSAIQKLPVIYLFTHDSIAVGSDGPTHQPVEQLMSLRAMPNVSLIRPADANEATVAWQAALETTDRPTILVFSRQNLPVLARTAKDAMNGVRRGGYVISPQQKKVPEGILIATGSEVALAIAAQRHLRQLGHDVSVVSLPSFDRFEQQSRSYREQVIPALVTFRMSIEMGTTLGWERYTGSRGVRIGMDTFGASGSTDALLNHFGFTAKRIANSYCKAFFADPKDRVTNRISSVL